MKLQRVANQMRAVMEPHTGSLVFLVGPESFGAREENTERTVPMRSKLLISAATLLATVALASAQNMPSGQSGAAPSAQSQGGAGAAGDRQSPQSSPSRQMQQKDHTTTGQAPREPGATKSGQQELKAQEHKSQRDQKDQKAQQRGQRDQTTGQAPREQGQSPSQQGQSPSQMQRQQTQQPSQQQGQPSGQATQQQGGGNVTLTTQQRTQIRQTVLTGANVPRANNVNFAVSVGTVVPTSVRVVAVPSVLIDIHPEWRGHSYFVVGDEIIIVDSGHRIIAVLAV